MNMQRMKYSMPTKPAFLNKCLPGSSLALKGEKCTRGKKAKERVIALVTANMSGTEKLTLIAIGNSLKPRCLKNVRNLPVEYTVNKNSWMMSVIFETWLRKFYRKFLGQDRSIAIEVGNCRVHPNIDGLRNIRLIFLQRNTTYSHVIRKLLNIHSLKRYFQARVVGKYLDHIKDKISINSGKQTTS